MPPPTADATRRRRTLATLGSVLTWGALLLAVATMGTLLFLVQQPWFLGDPRLARIGAAVATVAALATLFVVGPAQRWLHPEHQLSATSWTHRVGAALRLLTWVAVLALSLFLGSTTLLLGVVLLSLVGTVLRRMVALRTVREALAHASEGAYDDALATVAGAWWMPDGEQQGLLAALELDAGRTDEAEARLRRILEAPEPRLKRAHHLSMLAIALGDQGRLPEAIDAATEADALHPEQPAVVLRLATLHARHGHLEPGLVERAIEAVEATERALAPAAMAPALVPLQQASLAFVLAVAGRSVEARQRLDALALPDGPTEAAEVHHRMGLAWRALGDEPAARDHFQAGAVLGGATERRCREALASGHA